MNDHLPMLKQYLQELSDRLSLDWRFNYQDLKVKDDGVVHVEVSSRELFDLMASSPPGELRMISRSGDLIVLAGGETPVVNVRLLHPDNRYVLLAVLSVADLRRRPEHASELLSQGIMGEWFYLLKEKGDWSLCRMEDGYLGWVRSWYVRKVGRNEIQNYRDRCNAMVVGNVTYVYSEPSNESIPISDLVAGTKLVVESGEEKYLPAELPSGRRGYIRSIDIEFLGTQSGNIRDRIVSRAKRFVGIPYVWGGTSSKGFDCSGLVKRVFDMEGIVMPRDSDLQAGVGKLIPPDKLCEAKKGDLLFFGEGGKVSHVAIYLGEFEFIHAYGEVKINSLSADSAIYDEKLAGTLLFARRIL